jgi:carbonic anhydrase
VQAPLQNRSSFLRTAGGLAAGLTFVGAQTACSGTSHVEKRVDTPDQALKRLLAGNARFVAGELVATTAISERRADVSGGQMPYAIVLTCADSRVPPEHIFDQSLGHIFVCRIAGNILQPGIVGSIEYAVEHFHSLVVMVLGHQSCGAVTDTIKLVKSRGKAPGEIQSIVDAIAPVVRATKRGSLGEAAYLDKVIGENAKSVARALQKESEIVRHARDKGKLRVVAAEYSLRSGKVTLL